MAAAPRGISERGELGRRRCGAVKAAAARENSGAAEDRGRACGDRLARDRGEGGDGGGVAAAPRARAASVAHGGDGCCPTIAKECGGSA